MSASWREGLWLAVGGLMLWSATGYYALAERWMNLVFCIGGILIGREGMRFARRPARRMFIFEMVMACALMLLILLSFVAPQD